MVKVRYERKQYDAMTKFEKRHHPDIWKFVMDKVGRTENLELLDVSDEASVFALNLAESYPSNKLTCALRGDAPNFPLPANVTCKKVDFRKSLEDIAGIGKFDAIIANELTHEIADLGAFFTALKALLKPGAPIVVITRPKNPPIPIPEVCLTLWRTLAPSKEEFMSAASAAQLSSLFFSAAVPVTVDRKEWEEILYAGCFPAVRNTHKCGEPEIRNFINGKSGNIAFEEKLSIFLFRAQS